MRMKEAINGRLVYNRKRNQVERIRSTNLNGSSLMVSRHGDDLMAAKLSDLRYATQDEVDVYKAETAVNQSIQNGIVTRNGGTV